MVDVEIIWLGFLASLIAGLATGVGALPILFISKVSEKFLDAMMGFAAGVMLAASAFSLVVPAIAMGGIWLTAIGFLTGAVLLDAVDRFTPHVHFIADPEGPSSSLRRIWLLILAITIHNFPEGLAVGRWVRWRR